MVNGFWLAFSMNIIYSKKKKEEKTTKKCSSSVVVFECAMIHKIIEFVGLLQQFACTIPNHYQ